MKTARNHRVSVTDIDRRVHVSEVLQKVPALSKGAHADADDGMCIMEAVAFVAGEPWSDHPECACPVIAAFLRAWNDGLPDDDRDRLLRPLIPRLVGTRSDVATERRRATMAADWLIRVHTPVWLRLAKLDAQAQALASLPEITDFAQYPSLMQPLEAARKDAAAAVAAAVAAAGGAAWAAGAAVGAAWAAGATAGAAVAAVDAAWAAAWAAGHATGAAAVAAWAAAGAAAGAAMKPTLLELQRSALELIERMIAA